MIKNMHKYLFFAISKMRIKKNNFDVYMQSRNKSIEGVLVMLYWRGKKKLRKIKKKLILKNTKSFK